MVYFEIGNVELFMSRQENIRNVYIVSSIEEVDTLLGSLKESEHIRILSEEEIKYRDLGYRCTPAICADQLPPSVRLNQSPSISLYFELPKDEEPPININISNQYLINLIFPDRSDIRVSDGALVIIDSAEPNICPQTKTLLSQIVTECIKPVLFVNKVDNLIIEPQLNNEQVYQTLYKAIESVVGKIDDNQLDFKLSPEIGTTIFGSSKQGWGFCIRDFVQLYTVKFISLGIPKEKLTNLFWGDNYFDIVNKKWITQPTNTTQNDHQSKRGFCLFILEPIRQILNAAIDGNKEKINKIISTLGIQTDSEFWELQPYGKVFFRGIMRNFVPLFKNINTIIVNHLPSPIVAQKYRFDKIYSGPMDEKYSNAIRMCDPNGPLMVYVYKIIGTNKPNQYYGFGRVFSGTIKKDQQVIINGISQTIQHPLFLNGRIAEKIEGCPCGNIIGIAGIDQSIMSFGTITT